jgi:tRNA nucleotidyltransferase (CCA-adding enzyme)
VNISTSVLSARVPNAVRKICQRLSESGYPSWLVGGSVRDALLDTLAGRTEREAPAGSDWDIATAARPEQVTALFRRVIPTGIQHGTVTVLLDDDKFEVTTLRGETSYSDGRRPDSVYFVDDITADLARRDFTINAIAYDALNDRLIDPFGGLDDLRARTLRAVGVPAERFAEDGLRVLRAARFVATLEAALDPVTARAIEPSLGSYRKVSAERVRDEWMKTMKAPRPSRAFEVMREHGLLAVTAPELLESVGCEQNRFHTYDVWGHAMACLDACPESPVLRLSGLFHDVGKPRTRAFSDKTQDYTFYEHERVGAEMVGPILERLRFSNEERERVVQLVRHHLICYDASWSDTAVRRWLRRVTPELVPELYLLATADGVAKGKDLEPHLAQLEALKVHVERVLAEGAALSVKDLAIGGKELARDLGLRPGPLFGEILRTLLDEVVEDPAKNQRDVLLARAGEIAKSATAAS